MYVVHGVSGVALIALVISHIYFAIRPDKWWITKSMIYGWIPRSEYLGTHDPARWVVTGGGEGADEPELVSAGVAHESAGGATGEEESNPFDAGAAS